MQAFDQSPTDARFVQNPYRFYERTRATGSLFFWNDYQMICATSATSVGAILRDRRFGREVPEEMREAIADHLKPFYAVEANSMLELEPPRHTRLRSNVLRAFTSRRIAELAPEIAALSHQLIDAFPGGEFDLLTQFAQKLPVIVIARLLGVPDERADDLLAWSRAMVSMYQARRTRAIEDAAISATNEFVAYLRDHIEKRRVRPADDLITHLISAGTVEDRLSTDEIISTCILLLNAGHEASAHMMGNGVKALIENGFGPEVLTPDRIEATVEEILRFDPPLHLFIRHAYDDVEVVGHTFRRGDKVGLLLGAANRDPQVWDGPQRFNPGRPVKANHSFSAGIHFCVGAPLARLELQTALPILFERVPGLRIARKPRYANLYHFHGLEKLMVAA